ncbi:MAG: hypothetical protein K8L91_01430 [Anaerolineae bacterium]|nr:hypothetical protein [Anaerolineae bacterium]
MLSDNLVQESRRLSHAEKLSAMQLLVHELASEEVGLLREDIEYPIITPFGNEQAAKTLLEYLEEKPNRNG